MKTLLSLFLFCLSLTTFADDRFKNIELAISSGDALSAQRDFSRDLSAARASADIAQLAETGKPVIMEKIKEIQPHFYIAKVLVNDEVQTWIFEDDENGKFTWFGYKITGAISAELGQGADVASTVIGLSMGAVEANPLGIGILPLKVYLLNRSRNVGFKDCMNERATLDSIGWGAAVANGITLATGGAGLPFSILMILGTSVMRWDDAVDTAMYECAEFELEKDI